MTMSRKLVLTLASAALLAGTGSPVFAHGDWTFDNSYWKQQLNRDGERNTLGKLESGPFAVGPRETMNDAGSESRAAGTGFATANEAEKVRLDAAGFSQYNP